MQLNCLGVNLDHLNECLDGSILLFVEQKVQPLKIGARQNAGLEY